MWLRRALSKLRYWYSQAYHPDSTGFSERLGQVRCLNISLFLAADNPSPYLFTLRVIYPSVELYNQKLRWLNHVMMTDSALASDWCRYDFREVSLYTFLTDSKGTHLDPVSSLATFQKNALTFLHNLDTLQRSDAIGSAGHNARVLLKFSQHLLEVFRTLIHYTHHDKTQ